MPQVSVRKRSDGVWILAHLVEESAGALEIIHVSTVRFTSPELHIRDLHIAPIYRASVAGECRSIQSDSQ